MSEKLYIGATLKLAPFAPNSFESRPKVSEKCRFSKIPCTVIYINRPHRFFRVRFTFEHGSFTESFKFIEKGDILQKNNSRM